MNSKHRGRRRFLKESAALALLSQGAGGLPGLALGAIRSANGQTLGSERPAVPPRDSRAYGERSRFEKSARWPIEGNWENPPSVYAASRTPLQDLVGSITPSGLHFYIDHSSPFPLPDIDPQQHRLLIHGMVDRPLIFTVAELKLLPSVSRVHFLECGINSNPGSTIRRYPGFHETAQTVHGATSCSEWTGVLLSLLLKEAGVQRGASFIVAEGGSGLGGRRALCWRRPWTTL